MPNSTAKKPKILVHSCCAPCLTHPLFELQKKGFEVVLFFYNPNIHPREEYEMRLAEARKYCENKCEIVEGEYDVENWFAKIKGFENEPERGARCRICYEMRLAKTAAVAAKSGFQFFASTLSISPHKNANWLNEIGRELSSKYGVEFLEADWKKCDGFKKSLELSSAANLKRQNYCGCVFSRQPVDTSRQPVDTSRQPVDKMTRQLPHREPVKMSTRQQFFWGKASRQVVDILRCPVDNFERLNERALARNRQTQTTSRDLPFKFWEKDENWRLVELVDGTFGWLPSSYIRIVKALNYWDKIKLAPKNKLTPLPFPTAAKIARILKQFAGAPYLWGGTTKAGMDCSAFVQKFVFMVGGILLPRNSREQKKRGRPVHSTKLCSLDILFFVHSTTSRHHVGVYWNDAVVHFCLDKRGLTTESLDSMKKRYNHVATRRIFKLQNA